MKCDRLKTNIKNESLTSGASVIGASLDPCFGNDRGSLLESLDKFFESLKPLNYELKKSFGIDNLAIT